MPVPFFGKKIGGIWEELYCLPSHLMGAWTSKRRRGGVYVTKLESLSPPILADERRRANYETGGNTGGQKTGLVSTLFQET